MIAQTRAHVVWWLARLSDKLGTGVRNPAGAKIFAFHFVEHFFQNLTNIDLTEFLKFSSTKFYSV